MSIEVNGTSEDIGRIADSEQVLRYLNRYGQVLVTNYRDFVLLGKNADANQEHTSTRDRD